MESIKNYIKDDNNINKTIWFNEYNMFKNDNFSISNISLIYNSPIFKIYEGIKVDAQSTCLNSTGNINFIDKKFLNNNNEVYIVQLKFIDFFNESIDIKYTFERIEESYNKDTLLFLKKVCMKRIGYIYNKDENNISLVYLKENNKLFNFEKLITEYTGSCNYILYKLQIVYDLIFYIQILNNIKKKFGFIHPTLIFFNNKTNSYCFMDFIYDDLLTYTDKSNICHILPNFGYLSLNDIDTIELSGYNYLQTKYMENYLKTDYILILCFINYLFSSKKINKIKEALGSIKSFEQVITELNKDYMLENQKLLNFLSYNNDLYIKTLIEELFSLDYQSIKNMDCFDLALSRLIKKELEGQQCYDCKDVDFNKFFKNVNDDVKNTNMENFNFDNKETFDSLKENIVLQNTNDNIYTIKEADNEINKEEILKTSYNVRRNTPKHFNSNRIENKTIIKKLNCLLKNNENTFLSKFNTEAINIPVQNYLKKFYKRINCICFHLLCISCFENHKCEKLVEFRYYQTLNKTSDITNKIVATDDKINSLVKLNYVDTNKYFVQDIESNLNKINNIQSILVRLIRQHEDIVQNLIQYIENNHINYYIKNEYEFIKNKLMYLKYNLFMLTSQIKIFNTNTDASLNVNYSNIYNKSSLLERYDDISENYNDNINIIDNKTDIKSSISNNIDKLIKNKNNYYTSAIKIDKHLDDFYNLAQTFKTYKETINKNTKHFFIVFKELLEYSNVYKNNIKKLEKINFDKFNKQLCILNEFLAEKELKLINQCLLSNKYNYNFIASIIDNKLIIYNIYSNKKTLIEKPIYINNFKNSRFLFHNNKLYITGGLWFKHNGDNTQKSNDELTSYTHSKNLFLVITINDKQNINSNYEDSLDYTVSEPKQLSSMKNCRDLHSFIMINEFEMIVIGGYSCTECEIYNMFTKTWDILPSLNEPLYNTSTLLHNKRNVYVFFGLIGCVKNDRNKEAVYYNYVQKLKLYNPDSNTNKWEIIRVSFPSFKSYVIQCGLYSIYGTNEIYLFGGKKIECKGEYEKENFNTNNKQEKSKVFFNNSLSDKILVFDCCNHKLKILKDSNLGENMYFNQSYMNDLGDSFGQLNNMGNLILFKKSLFNEENKI